MLLPRSACGHFLMITQASAACRLFREAFPDPRCPPQPRHISLRGPAALYLADIFGYPLPPGRVSLLRGPGMSPSHGPSFSLHRVRSEPPSSVSAQPQGSAHLLPFSLREHSGDNEFPQGPQTLGSLSCGTSAGDTRELRPSPRSSAASPRLSFSSVTEASEMRVPSVARQSHRTHLPQRVCQRAPRKPGPGWPVMLWRPYPPSGCCSVSIPCVDCTVATYPLPGEELTREKPRLATCPGVAAGGAGSIVTCLLLFSAGPGSCHRAVSLPLSKLYMIIFDEHIPFISLDEML